MRLVCIPTVEGPQTLSDNRIGNSPCDKGDRAILPEGLYARTSHSQFSLQETVKTVLHLWWLCGSILRKHELESAGLRTRRLRRLLRVN